MGQSRECLDRNVKPDAEPVIARAHDGTQTNPNPSSEGAAGSRFDEPPRAAHRKEKARVRFNSNAGATAAPSRGVTMPACPPTASASPEAVSSLQKPRPSVLRNNSSGIIPTVGGLDPAAASDPEKLISAVAAQERAQKIAKRLERDPSQADTKDSFDITYGFGHDDFGRLGEEACRTLRTTEPVHNCQATAQDGDAAERGGVSSQQDRSASEALNLVQTHLSRMEEARQPSSSSNEAAPPKNQYVPTEVNDGLFDDVYNVPPPQKYRGGVLSQLLKLQRPLEICHHQNQKPTASSTNGQVTPVSEPGATTPARRKWYEQNRSQDTLANLVEASARLANPNRQGTEAKCPGKKWPTHKRAGSNSRLSSLWQKDEYRVTVQIAETLTRHRYIIKLCRSLMSFGAPTHRLEEYLNMTARVLEIEGQFLYLPGCMIISFDDRSTHTAEVKIVRVAQDIDLGKLKDVHHIYKDVLHDVISVEEGIQQLDSLIGSSTKFSPWIRVLIFGLTSATCVPFSFKARLIDLPLSFAFGCLVGLLQLILAPKSNLYNNVFEVSATVLISFLARAFGSIGGGKVLLLGACAERHRHASAWVLLCSALELQSRAIVPGSIRIVYAIIYCLLLGFGITVGSALYGLIDNRASSATTCDNPMPYTHGFIFVPLFILCICMLYQAKWRQMPVMVIIAFTGYIVNFFSSLQFAASPQITNTLGALSVGLLTNLYSRIRHGVAAAALIPAIFTQVPGGLASTGGLVSGLSTANLLTNSSQPVNGTSLMPLKDGQSLNSVVFDVATSMIQIAIGIAVGLFMSAFIVYPFGKRRSSLFSF